MPICEIERYELWTSKIHVEATNEAEAIAKVLNCEGKPVEDSPVFIQVANYYGLPADKFPELVKALEKLDVRIENNLIESIRSIDTV